jgi:hypothetical protein
MKKYGIEPPDKKTLSNPNIEIAKIEEFRDSGIQGFWN